MNKIIIPTVAIAMGAALVGSVSSTLAWYQYSTKAQAAYIGTSIGKSESLEIRYKDSQGNWAGWKNSLDSTDIGYLMSEGYGTNLVPITTDAHLENAAFRAQKPFYNGIETGVAGYGDENDEHVADNSNMVQFVLNIRYRKTANDSSYEAKALKLSDLTITAINDGPNETKVVSDMYKSVRVHFAAGTGSNATYALFAKDEDSNDDVLITDTFGPLDTDNDGQYDKAMKYEWETGADSAVTYGVDGHTQRAYNAHKYTADAFNFDLGTLPADNADGLAVTVTIWLEGWQKLSSVPAGNKDIVAPTEQEPNPTSYSAIWDPTAYFNKNFQVGMRFKAADLPNNNG